jgi:hypothetical protein
MRARFLATLLMFGSAGVSAAPSTKVALRIAPELDQQYPLLRSIVSASGVAEIAEPADLLLTTGEELNDYAELDPVEGSSLNTVRLGKFASGEAQSALPRVLALLQRQKALIDLAKGSPPGGIEICRVDRDHPDKCLPKTEASAQGGWLSTAFRNRSAAPKFVAIVETSADLAIKARALHGSDFVVRLKPGERLFVPPSGFGSTGTSYQVVLVSDAPFDPSRFAQPSSLGSSITCYVRLYPECVATAPPQTPMDGLSGKAFAYADQDRAYDAEEAPPPAMGGGYQVTRGDAEWMVELYAVHDYSAKQIEDDKKLPALQQQHLAERSPEELAHACGGTIIGRDLVLTAAHCVATGRFLPPNESRVFDDRRVRVGSLLIGRGGETRAIVGMVIHQGYTGLGTGLPNDIALLLLKSDEPVRLGVPSLKVASILPKSGSTLAGLGWGFTQSVAQGANINLNESNQVQHNPQMLQVAQLEVIGATACSKRVNAKLQAGMLCLVTPRSVAASGGRPTFSCRGDSGGPLVRNYRSGEEELVGLTSWSLGCGDKDTPSVYTDVAHFSRWVDAARKAIRPGTVVRVGDPPQSP